MSIYIYMKNTVLFAAFAVTICSRPSLADFAGMSIVAITGPDEMVLESGDFVRPFRLFANFDHPEDTLLSVGIADLKVSSPGCLYQHPFGSDTAPLSALIAAFPDLLGHWGPCSPSGLRISVVLSGFS